MATIVTRGGKGSPLTNNEVDNNFINLNTELAGKAALSSLATVATTGSYSDLVGAPTNVSAFSNDAGYITSSGSITGNATTATRLATARTISLAGDVTGSATFDGSANITITAAVADDSHAHIIGNIDGLQAALNGKAALGANSDITSMTGITGGISTPDYIDFDTAATPARATGRLWWDNADGVSTLNLGMAGSDVTLQVGQETHFRIKASSAITNGQVVMFTGTVGASGALTGAPASGITADTGSYIMGVATESIALNGWGYVTQFGLVRGVDTSGGTEAWTDGQILYYDPTVSGGLTKNVPSAPNAKVEVAAVVYAHATNGSLFVRVAANPSLEQLSDVETAAASNTDLLQYNGTAGKWEHKSPTLITTGNADKLTTARTISLTGDVSGSTSFDGSANVSISAVVADDSHNHIISNVGGLQTALDGKVAKAGDTMTGTLRVGGASLGHVTLAKGNSTRSGYVEFKMADNTRVGYVGYADTQYIDIWAENSRQFRFNGAPTVMGNTIFHDGYHPNADKLTTARTISLTGDVSGSTSFDGSANVSISAVVADDSHNHIIGNVDGLQAALDDRLRRDGLTSYAVGATGTGTSANWYEVCNWVVSGQYNNFAARIAINGRAQSTSNYDLLVKGEYQVTDWYTITNLKLYATDGVPDGDKWKLVLDNATKTARLYYRRSGTDWINKTAVFVSNFLSGASFTYTNALHGTTEPVGDMNILRDASSFTQLVSSETAFGGDVSGTYNNIVVADDSHNHIITNVDGLQTALDGKLNLSGGTLSGDLYTGDNDIFLNDGWLYFKDTGQDSIRLNGNGEQIDFYNQTDGKYANIRVGRATGDIDFRAPIFYDSANTAKLVDPSSTSKVGTDNSYIQIGNDQSGKAGVIGNTATYDGTNLTYRTYWAYDSYYNGSNWAALRTSLGRKWMVDMGYHVNLFRVRYYNGTVSSPWADSAWSNLFIVDPNGSVEASGDFRAPIFYDSDNTGYYVNPNSTSVLWEGQVKGNRFSFELGTEGVGNTNRLLSFEGNYTNGQYAHRFRKEDVGGGVPLSLDYSQATAGSYTELIQWGPFTGDAGYRIRHNDSTLISGILNATSDVRAPIFYDSNDTGYFVDPNSTSVLSTIRPELIQHSSGATAIELTNATYTMISDPEANRKLYIGDSGDPANYYDNGRHQFRGAGGGSTTTGIQLAGHFEQGNNYAHPEIEWSSVSATGMAIFYLPGTTANYGMVHMVFDIYEYVTGKTATVIIGGHNWNTPLWYNNGCQVVGWTDKSVRLGVKNGRYCVVFGGVGSTWSYATIRLRKIHNSSVYNNVMDLLGNWSTEFTNTESFTTVSGDLRQLRTSNTFIADGDVRSPIFYDSIDTGYYLDPNSTVNNALRIRGGTLHGPNTSWGAYLAVGTNGHWSSSYASVATTNGNLHLDAVTGSDIYLNNYAGNQTYVRYAGANRLTVYGPSNYTEATGSLRAPIFYDSDNTGFFTNPASSSTMYEIAVTNTIYSSNWFRSYNNTGWYSQTHGGGIFMQDSTWVRVYNNKQFLCDNIIQSQNSVRGPVFYDSNNTAYLLDPNTTGNALRTAGWWRQDSTDWAGDIAGKIQYHANNWYFSAANEFIFRASNGGQPFYVTQGGVAVAQADMRAPIFYDSNNTGYYVDPASTSNCSTVQSIEFQNAAGDGRGHRFWASDSYKIYMSSTGNGTWGGRVAGETTSDYNMYFRMTGGTNRGFVFRGGASGTTAVAGIDASGNGRFIGDVVAYSTSDARLKENLEVIPNALDKVSSLTGYTFDWNDKQTAYEAGKRDVGIVAQDVEAVLPEVVVDREETGYKAVNYEKLVPLLIEAIKELKAEVETLKKG